MGNIKCFSFVFWGFLGKDVYYTVPSHFCKLLFTEGWNGRDTIKPNSLTLKIKIEITSFIIEMKLLFLMISIIKCSDFRRISTKNLM